MTQIHLGYEVGSGEAVGIPLRNLAVTGQTQESGKTTTLEALVKRSGLRAIAFVTKRGEGSFSEGNRIQPYFRERADWQFVDQLLEAQLREKNKFLRPWIMRICKNTRTLADVHREVRKALEKAKGINEGVYTQLDAYLQLIVPEIERADLAVSISLKPGLNVMDLSAYPTPMQMLFVQSAIDWVNEHEAGVVTIVPEAWEFIPEGKGSPVKNSAVTLVRKGSGIRNHIWVDSQDMAGVDKVILRGCPVWLIGVQRESNEIKRNLANIPAGIERPKPSEIARLERGEFYACFGKKTLKVYVQPAWMDDKTAASVALGYSPMPLPPQRTAALPAPTPKPTGEVTVNEKEAAELRETNERLDRENRELAEANRGLRERLLKLERNEGAAEQASISAPATLDTESLYQTIKNRLLKELPDHPRLLRIITEKPELRVSIERPMIEAKADSLRGRLAGLIAEGFFELSTSGGAVQKELARRGYNTSPGSLYPELDNLARMGFVTVEDGKDERGRARKEFCAVAGMKVNIVEA